MTSFFVVESITTEENECLRAVSALLGAIREGGYFVIAVTVGAEGYPAGEGTYFPAVNLSRRIFDTMPGIAYEIYMTTESDQPDREAVIIGKRISADR